MDMVTSALAENAQSGLSIDGNAKKLSASNEVVFSVLGTAERMWSSTLNWSGSHPWLFLLVIIFAMFALVQRRIGRTAIATMKAQYQLHRANAHAAHHPTLPLSLPPQRPPKEIGK
jgi:hypothetical protein